MNFYISEKIPLINVLENGQKLTDRDLVIGTQKGFKFFDDTRNPIKCFMLSLCGFRYSSLLEDNPVLNKGGSVKNLLYGNNHSLLQLAICSSYPNIQAQIKWFDYLMNNSADLSTKEALSNAFRSAVLLNKFVFAKFFKAKGADVELVLSKDAGLLKSILKRRNADLDVWYAWLPTLKEQGKFQNRLKVFSHVLDVKMDFDSFSGEGCNSSFSKVLASRMMKKLYLHMSKDGYLELHSSKTKKIVVEALESLEKNEDIYKKFGSLEKPIILHIGYWGTGSSHALYLGILGNKFVLSDTGGYRVCNTFFNSDTAVVIGNIDRENFSYEDFFQLQSLNKLECKDHMIKIKEIIEKLMLNKKIDTMTFQHQRSGSCAFTGLTGCLAGLAHISSMEEVFENGEASSWLSSDKKHILQDLQHLVFQVLTKFYFISHSKLLADPEFCSNPLFLSVFEELKNRFDSCRYYSSYVDLLERLDQKDMAQRFFELKQATEIKLTEVIQNMKGNSIEIEETVNKN